MSAAHRITFTRMENYGPGNGGGCEIMRGTECVGMIESSDTYRGQFRDSGYRVCGYSVTFFGSDGADRTYDVEHGASARSVLAAAKRYAREHFA